MPFEASPAGQHSLLALQFFEGARVLSDAQREKGRVLFRPTLMLAGHGLELLVKSCILLNGGTPDRSGRGGHQIFQMWDGDDCSLLRKRTVENALEVVRADRRAATYPDVPADSEVPECVQALIAELCMLHGEKKYPLRYPQSDRKKTGPSTPLLVKALYETSYDFVRNQCQFALPRGASTPN